MSSYIADNREVLSKSHYIRKATTREYWFDFRFNKFLQYQRQFGDEFCMVIFGSDTQEDAYVIPCKYISAIFTEGTLDRQNRWIGNIRNNILRLSGHGSIYVGEYYNALELLDTGENPAANINSLADISDTSEDIADRNSLLQKIALFNRKYREVAPYKKRVISEKVARPGIITDHLKEINDYKCQICGEQGFAQRNGTRYIEAHHLMELHQMIPGSYCSDNVIVVCPTCHKKLHYANVTLSPINKTHVEITINDNQYQFRRNIVSDE